MVGIVRGFNMGCGGCGSKKGKVVTTKPAQPVIAKHNILARKKCPACTFKHTAYAYVALTEAQHGYPEHVALARKELIKAKMPVSTSQQELKAQLDAKAKAVGHLVHAVEECPDMALSSKIRNAYIDIIDDKQPDLLPLLEEIEKVRLANKDTEDG